MKCLLDLNAVKVFSRALSAVSRLGDELWLDPTARGLAVRAVNSSHSAYGCFLFSPLFFLDYSLRSVTPQDNDATIRCKLSMKALLPLFRCVASLERNVERCLISLSGPLADRLTIRFFCRHGITRTHNLHFQDSEAPEAVFSSHLCPNVLKAPARLLTDVVLQFPSWQEEVTLTATPHRVTVRSHSEEGLPRDHTRATFTHILLEPTEFLKLEVMQGSEVTFCLKELRGFLSFAESNCLPVWLHLGTAGQPLCFSVNDVLLEASVVLATLLQSGSRTPGAPPPLHRCAAAEIPAASGGRRPAAAVMEVVLSSQGSPAPLLEELLLLQSPDRLLALHDQSCSGTTSTICSLLFRSASSQSMDLQDPNASLPVLVCDSDEGAVEDEEEKEE